MNPYESPSAAADSSGQFHHVLNQHDQRPRIAIVGSGIAGLTCAWLLRQRYQVELFEAGPEAGGHTQTTDVEWQGQSFAVNTGFIVYNDRTYPNFIRLLQLLGVETQVSDMSFSVRCEQTGLEYNGQNLDSLFAQRRNLLRPGFWGMIGDILRFNRETTRALHEGNLDPNETLGEYLRRQGYGANFCQHYIIPMGAAIWSSGCQGMLDFPLVFFLRFFDNHGLLSIKNRPQWRVIEGGSRSYVQTILQQLPDGSVHLNSPVLRLDRHEQGVTLFVASQENNRPQVLDFDQVILACHSDQALAMLAEPSADEQQILGAIAYQNNDVVLHTDVSLLPKSRKAWASWNYHLDSSQQQSAAVTYYMNRLQGFDASAGPFCVTLNRTHAINPDLIIRRFNYAHPVFTLEGMAAQKRHHLISGSRHTHYCGAYWFNGFHEDGVNSALRVCKALGVVLP
jgi:uncharacterized protein